MTVGIVIGLIGNITTGLIYLAPVNTFWHIVKKRSTGEFDSAPYIFKLLNAYFWTYYGIVKPNSTVVATVNAFGIVLEGIFVFIFILFAPPKPRARTALMAVTFDIAFPATVITLSVLMLDQQTQISTAGLLSAIFSMVAYGSPLSAMKTVITTKSVEYMPFLLSFILFVNGGVWTVYAILTKDFFIGIPNGTGLCLGMIQLVVYTMYWSPDKASSTSYIYDGVDGVQDLEDGQAVHEPLLRSPSTDDQITR